MSYCTEDTNGCLHLRHHALALDRQMSAEWSRFSGSMAQCAKDSVAPLQWSLAGWMPARIGRLSSGVGCRHPVTIHKAIVNTATAGPPYIRVCCLTLKRRYAFRADVWVGKALFQKGSGWKTMHDRNTNSTQKYQSHCVVYEKQNQRNFPRLLERNNTPKQGWLCCFLILKVHCASSKNGKNVKIAGTVAITVTKHAVKFWIKNL